MTHRRPPNFIVVLCDDLGYGDVSLDETGPIRTPNIAQMAVEGVYLSDYYAPANICTPSRAGLLTGRYPVRTGLGYEVIMQNDDRGLPLSEVTIAQALKPAGYVSGAVRQVASRTSRASHGRRPGTASMSSSASPTATTWRRSRSTRRKRVPTR